MLSKLIHVSLLLSISLLALAGPLQSRDPVPGLIDGLLTGILSAISQLIKDVLSGSKSAIDNTISSKPLICLQSVDKCCVWYDVSKELTSLFLERDGQCNDDARAAVRLGFHDAASWDKDSPYGGADGSFLMDFGEENRPENNGLQNVRNVLRGVQAKYKVGYADLAQYAHNHATISCPKGPRVRTFVGRKDGTRAAPAGLLPDTHASADSLIQLFANKGFSAHDLAALVGAHTTARQRFVDQTEGISGKPLDTTKGVWDVEFYNETLQNPTNDKIFVLPSDKVLSQHPSVADEWKSFVGNQPHWNEDYARAYFRMSLLGVTNLNELSDCTKTLPASRPNYVIPSKKKQ